MGRNRVPYIELQVMTNYSFLRGASHPQEIFSQAAALGYDALGITDLHSVAGLVSAYQAAKESGMRLITGSCLTLNDASRVLVYPENRAAWGRLCQILTLAYKRGGRDAFLLSWHDMLALGNDFCIILTTPPDDPARLARLQRLSNLAQNAQCHVYASLTRQFRGDDARYLESVARSAQAASIPCVVTNDVLYHDAQRHILQDVVTAIREGLTLEQLGDRREAFRDRHLKSLDEIEQNYRGFDDAIARTREIAQRCRFSLEDLHYQYPKETEHPGEQPQKTLERRVRSALPSRYPVRVPDDVDRQLKHELQLIETLGYAPYFLTVDTIVRYARSRGILCQGRGSAANSVVCYVLGITAIDPVRSGLLFERFVSKERHEPPDIDVDFESERREEVIQWIYRHYGRAHAALCATVMRFRPKGALRDVGKVFGFTDDVLGLLAKHLASSLHDPATLQARAQTLRIDLKERRMVLLLHLAAQLVGFPRQLGTHPGGFVLTHDRLDTLVPLQPTAMAERQIIVWDKDAIDVLRFMKVDILGLGMLGCVRRCFDLLEQHTRVKLDMASVPPEDGATFAMIRKADTLGTFQIESRAQMAMLPRLKPTTFYDLVVQVAIVRPGPIQGDMVHPYLRRREGLEETRYPSPQLESILGKTLGVPLFQEQAMQVAIACAGFTPGEADQLRRSMATFKFTGGVSKFKEKLVEGMVARGYAREFAERTFAQLEGFGSYGFPESHAASFALVAYVSSYLKCHHPDVFCAALLNSQPMGFYATAQIVRDAQAHGVRVEGVDINQSRWDCTLEPGPIPARGGPRFRVVRLGMRVVKGLANKDAALLVGHRMPRYESLDDVWRRTGVSIAALESLAAADAFRCFSINRRDALWCVKGLPATPLPLFQAARRFSNDDLPEQNEQHVNLPSMSPEIEVAEDYNATMLSLRAHPLSFMRAALAKKGIMSCAALLNVRDGQKVHVAGLVLMRQRPGTAKGVTFLTIEDETGTANLVIWRAHFEAQRPVVIGAEMLACSGRLQREGDVIHIVAKNLEDLTGWLHVRDPATGLYRAYERLRARDFH